MNSNGHKPCLTVDPATVVLVGGAGDVVDDVSSDEPGDVVGIVDESEGNRLVMSIMSSYEPFCHGILFRNKHG